MKPELFVRSRSVDETRRIAEAVATLVHPGDVVALTGDLGAGKTVFVQGAALALGVKARVTSPSFVLMREYQGDLPVLHLDVYRLNSLQELIDLGFEEYLEPRWVIFVEWGDAVAPMLPEEHLEVDIKAVSETDRAITLKPFGPNWFARIALLAERMSEWEQEAGAC
jgi:tRNA threonylcarbamoyladenosine biosynthesis protein TsaE